MRSLDDAEPSQAIARPSALVGKLEGFTTNHLRTGDETVVVQIAKDEQQRPPARPVERRMAISPNLPSHIAYGVQYIRRAAYTRVSKQPTERRPLMGMTYFEDLNVGDVWTSSKHAVDYEEMLAYGRKNDPWPIHIDSEAAAKTPFGGVIASGGYTISLMYRLTHEIVNQPDRRWAFLGGFDWHLKFIEPVRGGDQLHARVTILEKRPSSKPGRGIFKDFIELINDQGKVALSIEVTAMLATRPSDA
jgi:acyl dehydratase